MRTVHVIEPQKTPDPVNVVGEAITILAGGDLSKPFEMHIHSCLQEHQRHRENDWGGV